MKANRIAAAMAAAVLTVSALGMPVHAEEMPANKTWETHDTLSCVGSVSKMYVTTAVMQLVDAGKMDLDTPVTEYLPEFRMADPRYQAITVRMLMNHTSGIMGTTAGDFMLLDDRDPQVLDGLLTELGTQRLKADPGDFGAYCNDGFEVLELIVEKVSGQSFTDYLEEHICKPLGLQQTGTPWNAFRAEEQVETFQGGNIRFAPDYCMDLGSGGILSTAAEVCAFGSAFFRGDTRLLSERSKREMEQTAVTDEYEDGFGLGWDVVDYDDYKAAGVKVVSKGGDVVEQHAGLLVAPDEQISVAVLSSGGSSMYNELMAQALLDIALEEKGIHVEHPKPAPVETLDTVPEKYLAYADVYLSSESMFTVSFPEQKYMEITNVTSDKRETKQYLYTTGDSFVLMEGDLASGKAVQARERSVLHFRSRGGIDYICEDGYYEIGSGVSTHSYMLQRAAANPVSDKAQKAWDERSGKKYYLYNPKYSNTDYIEMASVKVMTSPEAPGYVSGCRIIDGEHAEAALAMPGGRDLRDLEIRQKDGTEYLVMTTQAIELIEEDAIPVLPSDLTEVPLHTKQAVWYRITAADNRTLELDIPEHAAVYVYDAYDRMTYSSYMTDYGNSVPLPENGKIVFLGETGGTISIKQ